MILHLQAVHLHKAHLQEPVSNHAENTKDVRMHCQ